MITKTISFKFGSGAVLLQEPVSPWGAATGLDSGDPLNRGKIDSTTITAVETNSLCPCKDSKQKLALPR